ncbi:MAG: ornithine cyclodeaminase family protein [Bacteroidetes Order II. Incertae sedis bacterium]|nr:ornithine cyclodeaminase family protein [Bacteroidetes Order II. bacterium]MBT5250609.1 ornithine cyclodeaminase family protein [Bacteroidetes Order II. bacterium]MBT6201287.1 ornithine cyclodeaminase family protein [Bacteroidetes Order II. bacterium]MBT6424853.1 ornithine cyclodeaminase family protein [Bacteroidetes Order II. bacterium]MBT6582221.1 ornithine cyclodeaminase family protein [Bacteroidetes Order II. bacterium]
MNIFDERLTQDLLDYPPLIEALDLAFKDDPYIPVRQHLTIPKDAADDATLLLMPAWNEAYIGVKLATIHPENPENGLPSVHASYLLKSAKTGANLAMLDGAALTRIRTAATSALAAQYLARDHASTLLMIGAGALSLPLIEAHCSVRPIDRIMLWNRGAERGRLLLEKLDSRAELVTDLDVAVSEADIISCATLSSLPLVRGECVRPGTHVDLVGAYTPSMRESDAQLIEHSSVFVDTRMGATHEAGDLIQVAREGRWTMDQILADLPDLCGGRHPGRQTEDEITVFKSVGASLEDLVAASLAYERFIA